MVRSAACALVDVDELRGARKKIVVFVVCTENGARKAIARTGLADLARARAHKSQWLRRLPSQSLVY